MKLLICNQHPHIHLGGSEIQCDHIATHLARRGHQVSYAAFCADAVEGDYDYRVIPMPQVGVAPVYELLRQEAPDLVYWRYKRNLFLRTASICRALGITSVFSISHINDTLRWPVGTPVTEPGWTALRVKNAVKRRAQQMVGRASFEGFRLFDGIVSLSRDLLARIPDYPAGPRHRATIYNSMIYRKVVPFRWPRPYVAWVANLKGPKNPERYIEAAEALKDRDLDFLMIGQIQHEERYGYLRDPAQLPENVHYLGQRSVQEVDAVLAGALCLAHTCSPEGFGNNFIQAWLQGTPTVTLYFDPDGIHHRERLGFSSTTPEQFVRDLRVLIDHPLMRQEMGQRARRYAVEQFDPERNTARFEEFFQEVLDGRGRRGRLDLAAGIWG